MFFLFFSFLSIIDLGQTKTSAGAGFLFINFVAQLLSSKIGPFHPKAQCLFFLLLWEFGC
jgi:hypothetical protein